MIKKIFWFVTLLAGPLGDAWALPLPVEQAQSSGVVGCRAAVESLSTFLLNGNPHSSKSTTHNQRPDNHLFNSQISIQHSDGNSVAVLNVVPVDGGKCDGSYTTVAANLKSCSVLRESLYRDWIFSGQYGELMTLTNQSGSVSKILIPNGAGCVAVSTEVIYGDLAVRR